MERLKPGAFAETLPGDVRKDDPALTQQAWQEWLTTQEGAIISLVSWAGTAPLIAYAELGTHPEQALFDDSPPWELPAPTLRQLLGTPTTENIPAVIQAILSPRESQNVENYLGFQEMAAALKALTENPQEFVGQFVADPHAYGINYQTTAAVAQTFLADTYESIYPDKRDRFVISPHEFTRIVLGCLFTPQSHGESWGWLHVPQITQAQWEDAVRLFIDRRKDEIAATQIKPVTLTEVGTALEAKQKERFEIMGVLPFLKLVQKLAPNIEPETALDALNFVETQDRDAPPETRALASQLNTGSLKKRADKPPIWFVNLPTGQTVSLDALKGIIGSHYHQLRKERITAQMPATRAALERQLLQDEQVPTPEDVELERAVGLLDPESAKAFISMVPSRANGSHKRRVLPKPETLSQQIVEAIAQEESWQRQPISPDFFQNLAETRYERILPNSGSAPIGRDVTPAEFARLSPKHQKHYVRVQTSREFYFVPQWQIQLLNRKAHACAASGESLVIFMPACPYNPYMFQDGLIRPVPGQPVLPHGMNHTGYTNLRGGAPLIQTLLNQENLGLEVNVGTGAEEWEQDRKRGMTRDDFRHALDQNHPFTVIATARELGETITAEQIAQGSDDDGIHPYSITGLREGTLSITANSLTGLAGGPEAWATIEDQARAITDEYFIQGKNQAVIERTKSARAGFYIYLLAVRAGIMKSWTGDTEPTATDYQTYLEQHYRRIVAQQRGIDPSQVNDQEIKLQFDHDLTEELRSDVYYYTTFHLMARERWGWERLVILAADSRPLHTLASDIAGTQSCLFMLYGNYEGADFRNGHTN
ncbi:MAG: hypothetical protein JW991_03325 [Candidatus Pacebacteria bacterium]|nr:hypothetical protein [Candidatus Paceibacterota bacterium]